MDNREAAVSETRKVFTDADYKLRDSVCDFVMDSDLNTQRAIREFRKNKLGSTEYARKTLSDLGAKMNNRALSPAQLELARNLLRQHKNLLVQIFGDDVKREQTREKARAESKANTLAASENSSEGGVDDSFDTQEFDTPVEN